MTGGVAEGALPHSLLNHGGEVQPGDCEPGRQRLRGVRRSSGNRSGNQACARLVESPAGAVLVPVLGEVKPTGVAKGAEAKQQKQKPAEMPKPPSPPT